MARARKSNDKQQTVYKELLSQLELGYYSGHIRLDSVEFHCPDIIDYPADPLEKVQISWQYSYEKTEHGFDANVIIRNTIKGDLNEYDQIDLEIGYNLHYGSKMTLPKTLYRKFAYDKVLPQVWPYFRDHALELYFRAGLRWVILPFEPETVIE